MTSLLKKKLSYAAALGVTVAGLILGGCGGGGGGSSAQVVSGVAAAGAPIAGEVSLKDSSTPAQTKTMAIGSDGSFAFDVTGMKAPFVIRASGVSAGTTYTLHSFAPGVGTANVNPLANAAMANAAGVADPATVYASPAAGTMQQIGAQLQASVSQLMGQLQPLLTMYGAQNMDPVSGHFVANHTGLDAMFDSTRISLVNGQLTVANGATGSPIFTCPVTSFATGSFMAGNMPVQTGVPAAPAGVTATGGAGQVTLSWNGVSGAMSYNVYWSLTSGVTTVTGTKIAAVAAPYLHTGLPAATTYYYIVTAVNMAGESPASAQASATTSATQPAVQVPVAPTGVAATGGSKQVTLSWSPVSGATSYNLYWSTTAGVTKTSGTRIAGVTSPYTQSGLADSTAYYYVVTAVNGAGESPASAQATATTAAASTIDGAALYKQYCFGCHGTLGPRTAAQITSAIASFSQMSQFRATGSTPLSSAQIAAIAASM